MTLTYERLELRAEQAEQRLAEAKRALQITEQARLDAEIAGRNALAVAAAAHRWAAAYLDSNVDLVEVRGAQADVLAAHDATTPSPNQTHVVVEKAAVERWKAIEKAARRLLADNESTPLLTAEVQAVHAALTGGAS